jgi:hypothetical protein
MATTQFSVRLIKEFTYRGQAQRFSNRYYLTGAAPADSAAWTTLVAGIKVLEQNLLGDSAYFKEAHGYLPGSEVAVHTEVMTGQGAITGGTKVPGDCAMVARWATSKRSTKNHTVYVFSYYHDVRSAGAPADNVYDPQLTAARTNLDLLHTGVTIGGVVRKRCTPDGAAAIGCAVNGFIGHRDFVN